MRASTPPTTTPPGAPSSCGSDGLDLALRRALEPAWHRGAPAQPRPQPLLDAWHEGAAAFPAELRAWAAPSLDVPDPEELGELLDRGFVGSACRRRRSRGADGRGALRAAASSCSATAARPCSCIPAPRPGPCRARPTGRPRRPGVVARAHALRGGHEHGLARVRGLGPVAPPSARVLRDARRARAAASRAARRRAAALSRRRHAGGVPRHLLVRPARDRRGDPRARRRLARLRLGPAGGRCPPSPTSARPSGSRSLSRNPAACSRSPRSRHEPALRGRPRPGRRSAGWLRGSPPSRPCGDRS